MANAEASGDVRLYCRVLVLQYWSLKKSEKLLLLLAYYSNLITARTLRDFKVSCTMPKRRDFKPFV
jgi:hypothetical protein